MGLQCTHVYFVRTPPLFGLFPKNSKYIALLSVCRYSLSFGKKISSVHLKIVLKITIYPTTLRKKKLFATYCHVTIGLLFFKAILSFDLWCWLRVRWVLFMVGGGGRINQHWKEYFLVTLW